MTARAVCRSCGHITCDAVDLPRECGKCGCPFVFYLQPAEAPMTPRPAPITIFCRACDVGYASTGETPTICPRCESAEPRWTRTPPYKLTVNDRKFLKAYCILAS